MSCSVGDFEVLVTGNNHENVDCVTSASTGVVHSYYKSTLPMLYVWLFGLTIDSDQLSWRSANSGFGFLLNMFEELNIRSRNPKYIPKSDAHFLTRLGNVFTQYHWQNSNSSLLSFESQIWKTQTSRKDLSPLLQAVNILSGTYHCRSIGVQI